MELLMTPPAADPVGTGAHGFGAVVAGGAAPAGWRAGFAAVFAGFLARLAEQDGECPGIPGEAAAETGAGLGADPGGFPPAQPEGGGGTAAMGRPGAVTPGLYGGKVGDRSTVTAGLETTLPAGASGAQTAEARMQTADASGRTAPTLTPLVAALNGSPDGAQPQMAAPGAVSVQAVQNGGQTPPPTPAQEPLPQTAQPASVANVMPTVSGEASPQAARTPDETAPQTGAAATRADTPLVLPTGGEVREMTAVEPRYAAPVPVQAVEETIARQVVYRVLGELEQLRGQTGRVMRLELQLHPAELGKVVVRLIWQTGGLEARFLAGDQTVRAAIEQALPQLREALGRQDVSLLDVSADLARDHDGEPMRRGPRGRLIRYVAAEQPDDPVARQPERTTAWAINRLV